MGAAGRRGRPSHSLPTAKGDYYDDSHHATPRHATPLALKHSYATRELLWHLEKMTDFDSQGHRFFAGDLTTAKILGLYFGIIISLVGVEGREFNPAHVLLLY